MAHKVCKWGGWDQLSFSICAYKFSDTPINCAHIYMYVCILFITTDTKISIINWIDQFYI